MKQKGRPRKEYVKKNLNISLEANRLISLVKNQGSFASDAIIEKWNKMYKVSVILLLSSILYGCSPFGKPIRNPQPKIIIDKHHKCFKW